MTTPYSSYLKSSAWQTRRLAAVARYAGRCTNCGRTAANVEVHHTSYHHNLAEVPDKALRPLCKSCHQQMHLTPDTFLTRWCTPTGSKVSYHKLRRDYTQLTPDAQAHVSTALAHLDYATYTASCYWRAIALHIQSAANWTCTYCQNAGNHVYFVVPVPTERGNALALMDSLKCYCSSCASFLYA